jgi:hypothetical protein
MFQPGKAAGTFMAALNHLSNPVGGAALGVIVLF